MMTMPNLYILLSTFNGEKYLEELLQSVLSQSYSHFQFWIRDDGSIDNTLSILQEYAALDNRIVVQSGPNIGVQSSFHSLLRSLEDARGFYAFCDQDDIWGVQKLEVAMNAITGSARPESTLYFARLSCVDSNNRYLYDTVLPRTPGIYNALVENSAIGCTCVFGHSLRIDFLRGNPMHMIMHDWWLYLCAASNGDLIYDEVPRIRYREHENTVTPREPGISRLKNRSRVLLAQIRKAEIGLESFTQAKHFLNTYPAHSTNIRTTMQFLNDTHGFSNIFKRAGFAWSTDLHRNKRLETLALKLVIIFDLY